MASQDSSVDLLAQAIIAQAQEEARRIKDNAEASAQRIESDAEREAAAQSQRAAIAETARIERESASELAAVHAAARRRILEAREQLIDLVFSEASARLEAARRDPSYSRILLGLVNEGVSALEGGRFIVAVAAEDLDLAKRALNLTPLPAKTVEVQADAQIRGGGCVIRQADGRCIYDNTFASIIQRHHLRLRAAVAEVLWGEGRRWDQA